MTKRMLIDASHPEETRVVVADGTRIEELDFESSAKRQLRGNVYLARVTRVEPSLQAAFVEYGGNRHGFLAFSEIHPDYYQIPYEDRIALLKAQEEEAIAEAELEDAADDAENDKEADEAAEASADADSEDDEASENEDASEDDEASGEEDEAQEEQVATAKKRRRQSSRRRYKIQEVIKRGQILLIQVVKEERGNKGAAMTTYLSLAGRYCVFMPNTPRGGGISRKIANGSDRKRLKTIVADLKVPQGIGVIVRTAGAKRTKTEIKRDYDYLSRLWETIRDNTLKSIAPCLIHEEGDLVKRSIRDLYDKDISEILVQGDDAYKSAKTFIKMLMPSHSKNVKAYKDDIPLFLRYDIERQLDDSLSSLVQLKSGGYLVIHPTEALVSVDVNSGRSTKERNVERTALKTNLEAADEVARQMRLRDLAGLIVIDFIDMDENKNNRAVQSRMQDALSRDRARVQAGRISQFGLMEISRQRRRRSLLDASTISCPHCQGVGRQRSTESSALRALRATAEKAVRGTTARIRLRVTPDVALYIINEKRAQLDEIQSDFDMFTELYADDSLIKPDFAIDVLQSRESKNGDPLAKVEAENRKERQKQDNAKSKSKKKKSSSKFDREEEPVETAEDGEDQSRRRRRRGRRGGRRRRGENTENAEANAAAETDVDASETSEDKPSKSRRRKAPKGKSAVSEKAETTQDDAESKPKAKRSGRRKAPGRKEAIESSEKETAKAETVKSEPAAEEKSEKAPASRSTARRAAPKRKAAPKAKTSKATKSKAAAKTAKDTPAEDTPAKKASSSRSTARRKAPARKTAPKESVKETPKSKAKKPASRKAPAKKAAAKKAPAKKATANKAPAKKAAPKKVPAKKAAAPKEKAKKPRTRKAPARKAAKIDAPEMLSVEVTPTTSEMPPEKAQRTSWLKRLTGRKKD